MPDELREVQLFSRPQARPLSCWVQENPHPVRLQATSPGTAEGRVLPATFLEARLVFNASVLRFAVAHRIDGDGTLAVNVTDGDVDVAWSDAPVSVDRVERHASRNALGLFHVDEVRPFRNETLRYEIPVNSSWNQGLLVRNGVRMDDFAVTGWTMTNVTVRVFAPNGTKMADVDRHHHHSENYAPEVRMLLTPGVWVVEVEARMHKALSPDVGYWHTVTFVY